MFNSNRNFVLLTLAPIFFYITSCTAPNKKLFGKKTPHEVYISQLEQTGLVKTSLGSKWLAAAHTALAQPLAIDIPYKETTYFAAERPGAAGYRLNARRGEKITIALLTDSLNGALLFMDLWKADSVQPKLLKAADTATLHIEYEVDSDDSYLLRIQPELLQDGFYTVSITTSGSLAFPVPDGAKSNIGSFWGASRDNGARRHEGIDIFGSFRTPVVAAAGGYVVSTKENNLGGKVVFLQPTAKNYTLYYAHLDSQLVAQGQYVKEGEPVGLMGNTGNAKTTPTHLHFGIYTNGGAVDPLPFVQKTKSPGEISASLTPLGHYARLLKRASVYNSTIAGGKKLQTLDEGTPVRIAGAAGGFYRILLPDQTEAYISASATSPSAAPFTTITTQSSTLLLNSAIVGAKPKAAIAAGTRLPVYGRYQHFYLVKSNELEGWIPAP